MYGMEQAHHFAAWQQMQTERHSCEGKHHQPQHHPISERGVQVEPQLAPPFAGGDSESLPPLLSVFRPHYPHAAQQYDDEEYRNVGHDTFAHLAGKQRLVQPCRVQTKRTVPLVCGLCGLLEIRYATALTTGAKHWHRQKAVFYVFCFSAPQYLSTESIFPLTQTVFHSIKK